MKDKRYANLMAMLAGALLLAGGEQPGGAAESEHEPGLALIPWPKSIHVEQGRVALTAASRVVARDPSLLPLAKILADELGLAMGMKPAVLEGPGKAGDIVLAIDPTIEADEPIRTLRNREVAYTTEGAYVLTAGDMVEVAGGNYRAVAEGTSTLLQSLRRSEDGASLPRMRIKDWPHADYMATMLDVARQNHPVAAVKQVVELCRLYRVRYLHLHLTDDQGWTFPSTAYPQLGSRNSGAHGGVAPEVYSLAELTELVAYAEARGVTLVPELELPGHSGAALRSFPEVFDAINPTTGKPVGMGCMNMSNEQLYDVLDTIVGEVCAVFKSSPYVHIGTDECQTGRLQLYTGYKDFMAKHQLENDGALANHFVRRVNDMVARRGKKAIKWEGLANDASKDIIVMTWDKGARTAERLLAQGYATITCPWDLGVPWEEWNMYICNGSHLKPTDAVLGSTVVMWEQNARDQVAILRERIPERQERTWGPGNRFSGSGWARRYNATDALAGRLLNIKSAMKWPCEIETTLTPDGLQEAVLAVDDWSKMVIAGDARRDLATWFLSASAPRKGDRFDVRPSTPVKLLEIEAFTGTPAGTHGLRGELQISGDGQAFKSVAAFDQNGYAKASFDGGATVNTVRLAWPDGQAEPVAIRDIRVRQVVEIADVIVNPNSEIGADKVALCVADAGFGYQTGRTAVSVINRGHSFAFHSGGGNAMEHAGFLRGTGTIQVNQGSMDSFRDSPLTLSGSEPNTFTGTWRVAQGRLTLAKPAGTVALAGTVIVGGQGENDCLFWQHSDQVDDEATVELLDSPRGAARLRLNGCSETFATLAMASGSRIVTDGGNRNGRLTVDALLIDGAPLPRGVYTSGSDWIEGCGLVTVGPVRRVEISGAVADPAAVFEPGDFAVLTAPAGLAMTGGPWTVPVDTGAFTFSITNTGQPLHVTGFICGQGGLQLRAEAPIEFSGASANAYGGPTVLAGAVRMNKPAGVTVFPGALTLDTAEGRPATLTWMSDEQLSDKTLLTVQGNGPATLDLANHRERLEKLVLTGSALIRTGEQGQLQLHQLVVNGEPVAPGTYRAATPWLEGHGTVVIDPKVDVAGLYLSPANQIGEGNVANLVGDTTFGYGTQRCAIPVLGNGHTLTFDSGNGNPFYYSGDLSGTGDVVFLMGPSYTGFKNAPMRLGGNRASTSAGPYHVRKGRVQLEKPEGVNAIGGDITVGGQGFNDCLYWKQSEQIADTAAIILIESPNSGAAYLNLNGHRETVVKVTVNGACRVETDGVDGKGGVLTVESLTVNGQERQAGSYTAETEKWIEGTGRVVVR